MLPVPVLVPVQSLGLFSLTDLRLAKVYDTVMTCYVLALDLVDDPALIQEYEAHHQRVWPGRA